ncbi:hypothetical protein [Pareuzebyella sediminis]|uniref:hypothetical protein n=1 Tax=Pareuzebyella sediminis TaxID=2607998 RepID=UPI001E290934|nr:hypothetical protein [Pareuzebyella sediminis]
MKFDSQEDFDNFKMDEERKKYLRLKNQSIESALLFFGYDQYELIKDKLRMSISNCLFSPTSEIREDFQFSGYLQSKVALPSSSFTRRGRDATNNS